MSLNTTPTVLASIDNTVGWHGVFEYRLRSETSTKAVYDLWDLTSNPNNWANSNSDGSIKVVFSTGTWADNGSANPSSVVENSDGTISLFNASNLLRYKFTKPTASTASWLSSGGGTSTEGVDVNSIFLDSSGALVSGQIAASEPTGSYPVTVGGVVVTGALATNPISHTTGTTTQFAIHLAYGGYGTWHLHQNYVTSALNTPIASVTIPDPTVVKRRVHCNFW